MTRTAASRWVSLGALLPLAAGLSLAMEGGLYANEIFFGCAVALFHGTGKAFLHRKMLRSRRGKTPFAGMPQLLAVSGLTVAILVGTYRLAGLDRPDLFLAIGLAGVLCLQAGEIMALHFKQAD